MTTVTVSAGRCQFCHRTADEVAQIVAGDSGFICDDCVRACVRACATLLAAKATDGAAAQYSEPDAFQRLFRHFAPRRAHEMLVRSRTFPIRQQVDLQQALDAILGELHVPNNFVGIQPQSRHEAVGFSQLLERRRGGIEIAPPQYEEIDSATATQCGA